MKNKYKKAEEVIYEDLCLLLKRNMKVDNLNGCTVLITGATGLLGSLAVKALLEYDIQYKYNINVIAYIRNMEKAKDIFSDYLENNYLSIIENDIINPVLIQEPVDYIIHLASATRSTDFVDFPVETIKTTINGTLSVLEFAKRNKNRMKGILYVSSLEIYGTGIINQPVDENSYGYIDILSKRSSYSESKRLAETLCISYQQEYDLPVKIARLAGTFGAGLSNDDTRIFGQFARSAAEGKDIILHTTGETARSYCYTMDAIAAFFTILEKGGKGEAYNVANRENFISVLQMAQLVVDNFPHKNIKVRMDIAQSLERYGYQPKVEIDLATKKLEALGWKPEYKLPEMFDRVVKYMELCCSK